MADEHLLRPSLCTKPLFVCCFPQCRWNRVGLTRGAGAHCARFGTVGAAALPSGRRCGAFSRDDYERIVEQNVDVLVPHVKIAVSSGEADTSSFVYISEGRKERVHHLLNESWPRLEGVLTPFLAVS